jgi:hypothetical protein
VVFSSTDRADGKKATVSLHVFSELSGGYAVAPTLPVAFSFKSN